MKTDVSLLKTQVGSLGRQMSTLQVGMDNVNDRLDTIELEFLPKRVSALEAVVGKGRTSGQ